MNLDISYEEMFKETLKEIFPHLHITSNEENETILHHLVNATKNVKFIKTIVSKKFITKNEISRTSKFTIAIDVIVEKNKCIVKHQFSIPEGKDFRDNEMITLIEDINHAIGECLSVLTNVNFDDIILDDEQNENDILYTLTSNDIFTIKIEDKNYLLFHIPKSIKEINDNLDLNRMNLTKLPSYIPNIKGSFDCSENLLTSLKGCPKEVGSCFFCNNNRLMSLKYSPSKIPNTFNCSKNFIESLEGSPKFIGENFYASDNKNLVSLNGIPKEVGGDFFLRNAGRKFTQETINLLCKVKGLVKINN